MKINTLNRKFPDKATSLEHFDENHETEEQKLHPKTQLYNRLSFSN